MKAANARRHEGAVQSEKESLIGHNASGEFTWHALRERGFNNYLQVLAAPRELGLRPPIASLAGPNVEPDVVAVPSSARHY